MPEIFIHRFMKVMRRIYAVNWQRLSLVTMFGLMIIATALYSFQPTVTATAAPPPDQHPELSLPPSDGNHQPYGTTHSCLPEEGLLPQSRLDLANVR